MTDTPDVFDNPSLARLDADLDELDGFYRTGLETLRDDLRRKGLTEAEAEAAVQGAQRYLAGQTEWPSEASGPEQAGWAFAAGLESGRKMVEVSDGTRRNGPPAFRGATPSPLGGRGGWPPVTFDTDVGLLQEPPD